MTVDRDTRRIIIGIVLLAIGSALYGVSGYYQRAMIMPEIQSGQFCESSNCIQSAIIQIIGEIGGAILSFVGVIVALIATFRKIGRTS